MNRHKKELLKNFTPQEIRHMEELDSKVRELHALIFPEEYDYMMDSYSDSQDRKKGINPMSSSYIEKIKSKRAYLGVPQLSESGMAIDNTTYKICQIEILARAEGKKTEWTEKINEISVNIALENEKLESEINERHKPIENIDRGNPETWTEIMIVNSYKRMEAADRWELEESISFEEFKKLLFEDKNFAFSNAPRKGMESPDYNPWK